MIPVQLKPEYPEFEADVRKKGLLFLAANPNPTNKEFKKHRYWSEASLQLHAAYDGQCAYTSKRLIFTGSVDHFLPKGKYPHLAYEWDNFRLARQTMNTRKGDTEEVVDPFLVQSGWFVLDMPSCLIKPSNELSRPERVLVNSTINILQLNHDDRLVQERCDLLVRLAQGMITLEFLDWDYPYLSSEVRRLGAEGDLKAIFSIS